MRRAGGANREASKEEHSDDTLRSLPSSPSPFVAGHSQHVSCKHDLHRCWCACVRRTCSQGRRAGQHSLVAVTASALRDFARKVVFISSVTGCVHPRGASECLPAGPPGRTLRAPRTGAREMDIFTGPRTGPRKWHIRAPRRGPPTGGPKGARTGGGCAVGKSTYQNPGALESGAARNSPDPH